MSYKGNREYKLDCNFKLWDFITDGCQFEPKYDKWATRYINKHRRQRDKRIIKNELAKVGDC